MKTHSRLVCAAVCAALLPAMAAGQTLVLTPDTVWMTYEPQPVKVVLETPLAATYRLSLEQCIGFGASISGSADSTAPYEWTVTVRPSKFPDRYDGGGCNLFAWRQVQGGAEIYTTDTRFDALPPQPGAPRNVSLTPEPGALDVHWAPGDPGLGIDRYTISWSPPDRGGSNHAVYSDGGARSHLINNLDPGEYTVEVTAGNEWGDGSAVVVSGRVTSSGPPTGSGTGGKDPDPKDPNQDPEPDQDPNQDPNQDPKSNSAPTVAVTCDPCSVVAGGVVGLQAEASDPDGDPLTYTWSADAGSLDQADQMEATWTAPDEPGEVLVSVAVTDDEGATATAAVTVTVEAPPEPTTLTLSADSEQVIEGEQIVLAAETDLPAPKRMQVSLTFDGTAARGSVNDYWVRIPTIYIPAGESRGELVLTAVDDEEAEGAETVVIEAESLDPALTAEPLTVVIHDELMPVPALPLGGLALLGLLLAWRGVIQVRAGRSSCL